MVQAGIALTGVAPTGVRESDGALVIGAAIQLGELAALPLLARRLPVLSEAAALAAPVSGGEESLGVAVAAAGGASADAGHAALCATLVALGAEVVLLGPDGQRVLPLEELPHADVTSETIVELRVPDPAVRSGGAVERTDDGRFVAVQVSIGEASVARSARVAVAAPGCTASRASAVERALMGRHPDDTVTRAAAARIPDARAAECASRAIARAVERAFGG